MSESHNTTDNPEVDHQETDVHVRAIIWFGVGLAAVALVLHVFPGGCRDSTQLRRSARRRWCIPWP
jgi:hypothetical protein